jgi:catechol 2,3-dioxygenase-like lactoylglutathione lyase family enzyme
MPGLSGVLETAIYVDDLDRARQFYAGKLGMGAMYEDERMSAYDAGRGGVFLVFKRGASRDGAAVAGGRIPGHDGGGPLHLAFAITADTLAAWEERLAAMGIAVESRVDWPRGSRSIYFRDPDNHLVELATPGLWPNG